MLSEFTTYVRLGLSHIADLKGYDHIVFLVALTAGFGPRDWRRLLWLVTAFTLGHSITLALATLDLVRVPSRPVEVLIALTIVVAGLFGVVSPRRSAGSDASQATSQRARYAMAGGFGLIHGLGFSSFLRSLLGSEEQIAQPLFAFNVGLEAGQLLIVLAVVAAGAAVCGGLGLARSGWAIGLSLVSALLGLQMLLARL